MIERLLIILVLAALSSGAYAVFKTSHKRRMKPGKLNGRPTLLYFHSDKCAPCITQSHFLEQVAQQWNGTLAIRKIDAGAEPETARQYGVFTLPTTILVDRLGQVRQINYGLTNTNKLAQQLQTL